MSSYIELHAASAFSFLQGASLPEALVDRAADLGYPALALLDRDGVYGAPRFHKAARAAGLRPIIGAELTIAADVAGRLRSGIGTSRSQLELPDFRLPTSDFVDSARPLRKRRTGYRNLCRLITRMKLRAPKGEGALTLEDLDGCTARPRRARRPRGARRRAATASAACSIASSASSAAISVYVELQRHFRRDEEADNQALVDAGRRRSACRSSRPAASASRRRPSGRSSTCSPAFTTTPISRRPGGGWRRTPSGT